MGNWADGPLIGFDIESTSPHPNVARIVSASIVLSEQNQEPVVTDWLVAVDEDIPAEATAVHSVTTEVARRDGKPLQDVLIEIRETLRQAWDDGIPVVIYNAPYPDEIESVVVDRSWPVRVSIEDPMRVCGRQR